jgi:glycosyltransferase involved in cell wall biosynthesis/ADP-heptose:LPS heptosyltransferase/Flp pilus assembly protein TadD/predicted O-methyltransferase YrrM
MMPKQPILTITMIVRNEEKHMSSAIQSLLCQTYNNFILVIVNNGSTDSTGEIADSYAKQDHRVTVSHLKLNDPFITYEIIDRTQTPYYMFAAGHDFYAPTFIEKCLAALETDPHVVLAYPRSSWFKDDKIIGEIPGVFDTRGMDSFSRVMVVAYGLVEAYPFYGIYRLASFKSLGRYHVVGADHVLLTELAFVGSFALIDECLFYLRRAEDWGDPITYRKKHLPHEPDGVGPFLRMVNAYMSIADRIAEPTDRNLFKMALFTNCMLRYRGVLGMFGESIESLLNRPGLKELSGILSDTVRFIEQDLQISYAGKGIPSAREGADCNIPQNQAISEMKQDSCVNSSARKSHIRIAGEVATPSDLTAVDGESEFARAIKELFTTIRPSKIIETGTYHGEGTTRVIAETLRELGLNDTVFCSIECNPDNYRQAMANLAHRNLDDRVTVLHGVSVPRGKLPGIEEIEASCVSNIEYDDIFVDHQEQQRALLYYRETDFTGVADDMLGRALEIYGESPDFVLLDSGGHMGNVEFNYLLSRLRGPCYLALDDIFHIKHHKSFRQMQEDPRFEILLTSKEKFGFCLAKFTPAPHENVNRLIWLRTDSIGDNILAASMLPHIREKFAKAHITVVCQEHIAELYEACPLVDDIVAFNRQRAMEDEGYRNSLVAGLRARNADLLLNSVYSRDPLADFIAIGSGARRSVVIEGDLSNMPSEMHERNNSLYTTVIPSPGSGKNELERHLDFLAGLGIHLENLAPTAWITPDDDRFADGLFRENGLDPGHTVLLFAGAQYDVRQYEGYGEALAPICREFGMNVIALGSADDLAISQRNLERIGSRTLNLCGKTTLRQSAALISRCRLAVGAETGLAHLACAVDVPNVILLGGGHFGRFMPYSPLTTIACLPLDCYGCNWRCRYGRSHCVKDLMPELFSEAIRLALSGAADRCRVVMQESSRWTPAPGRPSWQACNDHLRQDRVRVVVRGEGEAAPPRDSETPLPSFSVITPSYNQGEYIEQTIRSVAEQDYPDVEHIVIDGGSQDATVGILKSYPHLRWLSEKDRGQSDAINKGFRMATGDIIAWINSDDWYEPGTFHLVAGFFRRHLELNVVMGNCNLVDEQGNVFDTVVNHERGFDELKRHWVPRSIPTQPAIFFRRRLLDEFGLLDESLHYAMDYDLWMRFAQKNRFHHLDVTVANYRFHSGAKGGDQDWSKFLPDCNTVYKRYCEPIVSVIIPCYNYARYLLEAVGSVIGQTFQGFEIIIVDDGSTDNSRQVAEQLVTAFPQHSIRLITQENSGNPAFSRNRGIAEARGDYILCLDADDMLAPDMLDECLKVLEKDASISIAYTDRLDFDGVDQVVRAGDYNFDLLKHQNHISYCTLFRRKVWEDVGGYRPVGCEDWDFWIAAGARGHFGQRIPLPLFKYRRHDTGRFQEDSRNPEIVKAKIIVNNQSCYLREEVMAAESLLAKNSGLSNMSGPLVSVIVPTHNRPEMLVDTIRSILNQTYRNFEIIVVNDAGADVEGVINYLNRDGNITYVRHAQNRGLAAARNTGIKVSRGKYIAYLDDDDIFYPDHLETLVFSMIKGGHKVAYTDAHRAHQAMNSGRYSVTARDLPYSYDFDYDTILVTNFVPVLCFLHERACIDQTGFFDESLTTHEDWDMWIRMSRTFKFAHISKVTCEFTWRQDGTTMTSSLHEDFLRTTRVIYDKHRDLAAGKPSVQEARRNTLQTREKALVATRQVEQAAETVKPVPAGPSEDTRGNAKAIERRLERADSLAREGKFDDSVATYQSVLRIDRSNHRAMNGVGVVRLMTGDLEEAAASFNDALAINPEDAKATSGLGMVRSAQGKEMEAFDLFSRALDSDPENLTALSELLKISYRINRFDEAEQRLESYLRYHPADLNMLFSLAGVLAKKGKNSEAVEKLETILLFDPGFEGALEMQEMICGQLPIAV